MKIILDTFIAIVLPVLAFVGIIVTHIYYLLNLRDTLRTCAPENQLVKPSEVWLMLIPVFNIFWPLSLNTRISASIEKETAARPGLKTYGTKTYHAGLFHAISVLAVNVLVCLPYNSFTITVGAAAYGFMFLFWSKTAAWRNRVLEFDLQRLETAQ